MVPKDRLTAMLGGWLSTAMVFFVAAWLTECACAYGQTSACIPWLEKIPADYAAQQKKYDFSVVYADCRYPNGKAVLVIPLTILPSYPVPSPNAKKIESTVTVTIDRQKEEWAGVAQIFHYETGCIFNSAKLDASPMGFRIGDELQGGLYEQARTQKVIDELLHYPFRFLPSDKVGDFVQHQPNRPCKTSGQGW